MHIKTRLPISIVIMLVTSQLSIAQSGNNKTAAYMKTADQMIKKGNFKEAALAIDKLVAGGTIVPAEMLYQYARIYAETGEKSKSVKLLNDAIDKGWLSINQIKEDKDLHKAIGGMEMEKVLAKMRNVSAPYLNGTAVLSRDEKKSIIDLANRGVKSIYFDTVKATEMSAEITRMYNDGHFNQINTVSAFTKELVDYLRKKTNDKHFYIGVNYSELSERVPNLNVTTPEERNFGFAEVAIRKGNIGYLRWNECIAGPEAYKSAQSALNLLRNTRAIVIDISENGGGNGEMSTFLYHYLFKPDDKRFETLLIKKCRGEAEWHRSEPPVEPMAGGPNLGDKPIYIVTSENTFSAAEYFAFMMKELKRATIIGKNTGGGGNPVSLTGDGRYVMYVPICQITTESGKSLEGKGVAPDIEFVSNEWEKEMMEVVNANLK